MSAIMQAFGRGAPIRREGVLPVPPLRLESNPCEEASLVSSIDADEREASTALDEDIEAIAAAKMDTLKKHLADITAQTQEAKHEFDKVSKIWLGRQAQVREDLRDRRHEVFLLERRIAELQNRLRSGPPPPGPKCLNIVEGDMFMGVASLVIITNVVVMTIEVVSTDFSEDLSVLDNLFLLFYVVELCLKALYLQQYLLCGPISVVWWNWLDTIIVLVGLLEVLLKPIVYSSSKSHPHFMNYLRVLRLARLARLLKLVKVFVQSDLSWVEGTGFQSFIMGLIGFNAILLGLETEFTERAAMWFWIEQLLLLIFAFELVVRLKRSGCGGFFISSKDSVWNWLDFGIVLGGAVDQWMLPLINLSMSLAGLHISEGSVEIGQIMSMLRMVRLLRILRLVRLIKSIPPLYKLVVGIATAMQGMAWVMALTALVLYICALVGVKLVGPAGLLYRRDEDVPDDVRNAFPDIFGAVFNLFKVMNADMSPMEALFEYMPASKLVLGFYVVVTNWAIFSILTAVVSENMARVTQSTEAEAAAEEARMNQELLTDAIFDHLDPNDTGSFTPEDFAALLKDEDSIKDICDISESTPQDLRDYYEILCQGNDDEETCMPKISREAFLKGLQQDRLTVNQRCVMRISKRVEGMERRVEIGLVRLTNLLLGKRDNLPKHSRVPSRATSAA